MSTLFIVLVSQMWRFQSEVTIFSFERNAIDFTIALCPGSVAMHCCVWTSQIRTLPSSLPLARWVPSVLNATDHTRFVCPCSSAIHCCVCTFHKRTTLSLIHISEPTRLGMISYAV